MPNKPLSPVERRYLVRCRKLRDMPITRFTVLKSQVIRIALLTALLAIASPILEKNFIIFYIGLLVGMVLNSMNFLWHARSLTRLMLRIIDWDRVDRLLDGPEDDAPGIDRHPNQMIP